MLSHQDRNFQSPNHKKQVGHQSDTKHEKGFNWINWQWLDLTSFDPPTHQPSWPSSPEGKNRLPRRRNLWSPSLKTPKSGVFHLPRPEALKMCCFFNQVVQLPTQVHPNHPNPAGLSVPVSNPCCLFRIRQSRNGFLDRCQGLDDSAAGSWHPVGGRWEQPQPSKERSWNIVKWYYKPTKKKHQQI